MTIVRSDFGGGILALIFKGSEDTFRGSNRKMIFFPSEKDSTLKGKDLLPYRAACICRKTRFGMCGPVDITSTLWLTHLWI